MLLNNSIIPIKLIINSVRRINNNNSKILIKTITTTSSNSNLNLNLKKENKRNKLKNKNEILNNLIELYHLSKKFSPLNNENNKLNNYINNDLIPIDKNISRSPEPLNLIQLTRNQNQLYHEIEKVNQSNSNSNNSNSNSTLLTSTEINLNSSIQSYRSNQYYDETYSESFEKINILGSEPPLSNRMRRIMDTLHGTTAGGQAGLETLIEKGPGIMRIEEEKREEREREEKEEQEALEDERLAEETRLGV